MKRVCAFAVSHISYTLAYYAASQYYVGLRTWGLLLPTE